MDRLYKDLSLQAKQSVHLTDFPQATPAFINHKLEEQVNTARSLTSLALSLRKKEQIKVRQPLQKMIIPVKNQKERLRIEQISTQLKGEINVKEIELLDDANELLVKEVRPNFKALGPRFGKELKSVVQCISDLGSDQIAQLEEKGTLEVQINEKNITLERSDVELFFKDIEGWQVAQGSGMTVALDITLTPELKKEGIARELVNRIQNYRKDSGLEVIDQIEILLKNEEQLEEAVSDNRKYILSETLAKKLEFVSTIENGTTIEFDDIKTELHIKKVFS
jgi:isoleucyl-tRNA synthetase